MMKKKFFPVFAAFALITFSACNSNDDNDDTMTDSTSVTTTDVSTENSAEVKSYVDLNTGSTIKVRRDDQSGKYVNVETNTPVEYYFDPSTHDTFDVSGRVVNMALVRSNDGKYTIDESKIKFQDDGDLKMKSADGETKVKLETDGDGKIKTDSTKIKIRDGEVKVKND